jgi:hypothetical protein
MSEVAIAGNSVALLDAALDAAGGLERGREHSFLSAHLSQGGGLWAMKGQAGVLDDVRVDVALHQDWGSHHPFGAPELRSSFTPRRVEIRDADGTAVEADALSSAWACPLTFMPVGQKRLDRWLGPNVGPSACSQPRGPRASRDRPSMA